MPAASQPCAACVVEHHPVVEELVKRVMTARRGARDGGTSSSHESSAGLFPRLTLQGGLRHFERLTLGSVELYWERANAFGSTTLAAASICSGVGSSVMVVVLRQ